MNVKAIRNHHRQRPDGTAPIYIRITKNHKCKYISTGEFIKEEQWDSAAGVVIKNKMRTYINNMIAQKIQEIYETKYEIQKKQNGKASLRQIGQSAVVDKRNFFAYARQWCEREYNLPDSRRTYKRYLAHLSKLKQFLGHKDLKTLNDPNTDPVLEWFEIDHSFLSDYVSWLKRKKGNGINTIHSTLKSIRAIYYASTLEKVTQKGMNPFGHDGYKLTSEETHVDELTPEELKAMLNIELKENSSLFHAQSCMKLQYYLGGLRYGDAVTITYGMMDDNFTTFARQTMKTGKMVHVPIPEKARAIFKHYRQMSSDVKPTDFVLPQVKGATKENLLDKVSSANALANLHLKQLAKMVGRKGNCTTHMLRHAFAHEAYRQGKPLETIQRMLGHSNIITTQIYMRKLTGKEIGIEIADVVNNL